MDTNEYEVIIIGGGAAGLSAALTLGRARRKVLVIDAGRQSNLAAHAIGGLIGQVGVAPAALYEHTRTELGVHPTVSLLEESISSATRADDAFALTLASGGTIAADRLVLTMGMDYRTPEVAGFAERWGTTVFHCPFCHGWEVAGRPLAVLASDASVAHRAPLLTAWSDDVTVLTDGVELDSATRDTLATAGVSVDERAIDRLVGPGAELESIAFADGGERACGGVLVGAQLHQRSDLAEQLGLRLAEPGPVVVDAIEVDQMYRASVPGVWAAGDVAAQMPAITEAIATGMRAGAMVVGDITGAMPRNAG